MDHPQIFSSIAKPVRKRVWSVPAAINFFLGGTAAGYYLLFVSSLPDSPLPPFVRASGGLVASLLIMAGLASLTLEAGRPLRARFLASNWKRSWMSREAIAALVFILAVAVDAVAASSTARVVAMGAVCVFLLSQAMMFHGCTAVGIWRSPVFPVLFISSGIASGYGLVLLNFHGLLLPHIQLSTGARVVALVCLAVNCAAWFTLTRPGKDRDRENVSRRLSKPARLFAVVVIGQLLPFVLILMAKPWAIEADTMAVSLVAVFALLAGNWAQKSGLVYDSQQVCGLKMGDF